MERRKLFGEEPAAVNEKIALCQKYGITPIVCVSRKDGKWTFSADLNKEEQAEIIESLGK